MGSESIDGLTKVIVHLEASLRDFLHGAARDARVVRIPLVRPPPRGLHVLEVQLNDGRPPLVLHATSTGPLAPSGYPLRLTLPAPPPAAPHLGRLLAGGKLLIEAFIADGGAGLVYRARHRALHIDVAVKVLHDSYQDDKEFAQRFQAEALAASSLDHVNLTRVLDFGQEEDGLLYLAMEFLDGKSVRDLLVAERRLAPDRALLFVIQICSALTHAHGRGIVHRDIKPENLVVVPGVDDDGLASELIKVCDFGIAHRSAENEARNVCGTPHYMAPELVLGEPADAATDLYACGVLLYELVTGAVPFVDQTGEGAALEAKCAERFALPSTLVPGLDGRLDAIVTRALSAAKADRYASTRELRKAMLALTDLPQSSRRLMSAQPSTPPKPAKPAWLEVGTGYEESFRSEGAPRSTIPLAGPSSGLATPSRIAALVRQLVDTNDAERFAELARPLDATARELAAQGDTESLFRLHGALAMISAERTERARLAARSLNVFGDLAFLEPIADRALDPRTGKDRTAAKLLARAGATGAFALYAARRKNTALEARERFVAALSEIGPHALPVINAGLERMLPRLSIPGAIAIAEDLLRAVPETDHPTTSELLIHFAGVDVASLVEAAAAALSSVRGPRARITLRALLTHSDARVRTAAARALERAAT